MGSEMLPPFGWSEVFTRWQFAPIVTAFVAVFAALYLWGVVRVARRHPQRPWPLWRAGMFLAGLAVVVMATESGVGAYDDVLFWDHMIQHLLLIMVAPPLLVTGQPVTLLMHASRNPLHTWVKRLLRSRVISALTWPVFGIVAYVVTIVGTHLTGFMNLVMENSDIHDAEHALYLIVGYLYFLPLIGREPIRWKVSYPVRLFLLFMAMPVDAFTGVVLGSEGSVPWSSMATAPRPSWAPSALDDLHTGGAVMWVGGAAIMFVLIMFVFLAWSRDTRATSRSGWLESARRDNIGELVNSPVGLSGDVDDNEEHLDAYNAYLARLNGTEKH
jgi:cytochrome c oxidase assembly factor CtaG